MRGKSISPAVKGALWALLAVFILAAALFGLRQFRAADAFREEMARLGAGEGWTVTVRSLPLAEEVTLTGYEAGRLVSAALGLSFAGRDIAQRRRGQPHGLPVRHRRQTLRS